MTDPAGTEPRIQRFRESLDRLEENLGRIIVGHDDAIRQILAAILAGGHVLLEGSPGLGKTLMVKTLARMLDLEYSRIQFTPDLMPADLTGTNILVDTPGDGPTFRFQEGPLFGNVVLADEINRATPKTQSALLEAMEEKAITVARQTHPLKEPFFVLATQNPIEMQGTYPLPEAQLDRFLLKILMTRSDLGELVEIMTRTTGPTSAETEVVIGGTDLLDLQRLCRDVIVSRDMMEHIGTIVLATHPDSELAPDRVRRYVKYGSSPRGAQAIVRVAKVMALQRGRFNVSRTDVRDVAPPALRHRLILNFEGEAEGVVADGLIADILAANER